MTRIPEIVKREDLPEGQRHAFDEITASRGSVSGPFKVLLHSPEVARRIAHAGAYIRFENSIPEAVNELATLVTARELDCQFEWTAHVAHALRLGVREEAIAAIRDRKAPVGLTVEESLVATYALELLRKHRVSDRTFKAALRRFGLKSLMDLTATIGYYSMIGHALNAFEVEPDVPPLLPV